MDSICSLMETIFTFYIMEDITDTPFSWYYNSLFIK